MDIRISQIDGKDIDNIIDICSKEGWEAFVLRKANYIEAMKKSTVIVAYDGDTFLGFARAISDEYMTTFLCELLVAQEQRNKGIGKMLVGHLEVMFPETRFDLISDADGFYEKLKFRKLGTGFRLSGL